MNASALQASPLAEGHRKLWVIYIKRQWRVQGVESGTWKVVRLL